MSVPSLQTQPDVASLLSSLEYPFSFLRDGEYERKVTPMPGEPLEDIGEFPDNIAEYYWIHPGENDEEPWLCLCRLKNAVYVFFKGECDYTGFDCQGHMRIYASRNPNILLESAMTLHEYTLYCKAVGIKPEFPTLMIPS